MPSLPCSSNSPTPRLGRRGSAWAHASSRLNRWISPGRSRRRRATHGWRHGPDEGDSHPSRCTVPEPLPRSADGPRPRSAGRPVSPHPAQCSIPYPSAYRRGLGAPLRRAHRYVCASRSADGPSTSPFRLGGHFAPCRRRPLQTTSFHFHCRETVGSPSGQPLNALCRGSAGWITTGSLRSARARSAQAPGRRAAMRSADGARTTSSPASRSSATITDGGAGQVSNASRSSRRRRPSRSTR